MSLSPVLLNCHILRENVKEFLKKCDVKSDFYETKLHGGIRGPRVLEYGTVATGFSRNKGGERMHDQ